MLESKVEDYLDKRVTAAGGLYEKIIGRGWKGCPDGMVIWPGGDMELVECKRPIGGVTSVPQSRFHRKCADRGRKVHLINTLQLVDTFVDNWYFA